MLAIPDASEFGLFSSPGRPEVAWVAADCTGDGTMQIVAQAPAQRRLEIRPDCQGRRHEGHACEDRGGGRVLPNLTPDGSNDFSDPEFDTAEKPCYDQQALMRRYDVVARDLRLYAGDGLGSRIRTIMRTPTANSR